jgi:hypothetical protein
VVQGCDLDQLAAEHVGGLDLALIQQLPPDLPGLLKVVQQLPHDRSCRQLIQIAPLYHKLSETMHAHANQGRQHWGDAIGVGKVVEEALKLRESRGRE